MTQVNCAWTVQISVVGAFVDIACNYPDLTYAGWEVVLNGFVGATQVSAIARMGFGNFPPKGTFDLVYYPAGGGVDIGAITVVMS